MADSIVRLRVDSREYDTKIKRASEGILALERNLRTAGETFLQTWKEEQDFARGLGQMETVSKSARGRIAELTSAFTELSVVYKRMSDEEKNSPMGQAIKGSIDQLNARLQQEKKTLAEVTKELNATGGATNKFAGLVDALGNKLGVTGSLTEMLTSKSALLTGALGAVAAMAAKAAEEWANYNAELAKQDEQTTVITGLKGDDANNMTDSVRALSQTYGVDFRQAVEAANTLMSQFGTTGEEAISILKDGMQGMIRGDGAKLLSMIQQYAPAFQSAGVSASQLVAVIQNSEGGIFTDQNMSAIVMGIRNIRLMTNSTAAALAKLGIDSEKVTKAMEDGSMNVFDALKLVSGKLKDVDSNSKAAGEVMQAVFGRQGAMAGTNLGKAIDSLNTNLAETKRQTGEVGEAMADLQTANENLNKAIREAFGYDGWDQMTIGIKTKLIGALSDTIEALAKVRDIAVKTYDVLDLQLGVSNWIEAGTWVVGKMTEQFNGAYLIAKKLYDLINSQAEKQAGMDALGASGPTVADIVNRGKTKTPEPDVSVDPNKPVPGKGNGSQKTYRAESISSKYRQGIGIEVTESMASLQARMRRSQSDQAGATNIMDFQSAQQRIDELRKQIDAQPLALSLGWSVDKAAEFKDSLTDSINKMVEELDIQPISISLGFDENGNNLDEKAAQRSEKVIKDLTKTSNAAATATQGAATATNNLGAALASLDDPGAKAAGTVMQAIASIALGFAQAAAAADTTASGWGWLAWLGAGTAALATTIATVHSLTNFSEGGMVPGNSYSGDNQHYAYGLNAGEVVLNKAQQSNLAGQLEAPAAVAAARPSYVRGKDIFLGVNNYLKESGRGQLVTSR